MTVIEVSNNSPPNSKKAEAEKTITESHDDPSFLQPQQNPPSRITNKRVSFKPAPITGPPSEQESQICLRVAEIMPVPKDVILKTLRKIPGRKPRNVADTVNEVVDALLNYGTEEENRPVQGCAERPTQTDTSGMPKLEAATFPKAPPPPLDLEAASSSTEHNDIQQAIELSLQSQKQFFPTIPEDPEDWSRKELPVGIRNVGQTCWFNVIVQVLFHIPRYRKLIYFNTPDELKNVGESNLTPEAKFLMEIRRLFSLLDAGNKRVVEPTGAMKALEKEFGNALVGHQNDASEMRDRVIGVITRALRQAFDARNRSPLDLELPSIPAPMPSSSMEEVMEVDEGVDENMQVDDPAPPKGENESITIPNLPTFPRIPLPPKEDVWSESPFQHLFHYRTVKRRVNVGGGNAEFDRPAVSDMPTITCDVQKPSLHDAIEHHFTDDKTETYLETLPEVFFVSLNRFCYNNTSGTSKIHTELQIPKSIYMDRYMHRNYNLVKEIHWQREGLRRELDEYTARVNGLERFPVGPSSFNLIDILEATKMFSSEQNAHLRSADMILPTPKEGLIPPNFHRDFLNCIDAYVSDLHHQQEECKNRRDLLKNQLIELFEVAELQREEYLLHSIIIHEGEADRGHYWTYIRCDPNSNENDLWQKFNDSGVELVTWEQVSTEARGNYRPGVSAYALCYVKAKAQHLLSDAASEKYHERIPHLPDDLRHFIQKQNEDFKEEIRKFKESKEPPPPPPPVVFPKAEYTIFTPNGRQLMMEPLSSPMDPIFPTELNKRQFFEDTTHILKLAAVNRQYKYTEEEDFNQNLAMMVHCRCKAVLKERFAGTTFYTDDYKAMIEKLSHEMKMKLIPFIVEGIYESYCHPKPSSPRKDPRCDPVMWWLSTGLGISAFAYRYLILRGLKDSLIEPLKSMATEELQNLNTNKDVDQWNCLNSFIARLLANFTLMKQHLCLIKLTMIECTKMQLFDDNTVNDYFTHWVRTLIRGHLVLKVFSWLKNDMERYAAQIYRTINVNELVIEYSHAKITVIYPLLKLWRYVLYSILQTKRDSSAINALLDNGVFSLLSASLNHIAQWAVLDDDKICSVIHDSMKETLNMCGSLLPESHKHTLVNTTIENLAHALKPETVVPYQDDAHIEFFVASVEQELSDIVRLKIEIGFVDETDSLATVHRLVEEANSSIINEFQ